VEVDNLSESQTDGSDSECGQDE